MLEKLIAQNRWAVQPPGTPAQWAEQSWALGKAALVKPDTNIDEEYYRKQIPVVDERMALGGVRLAVVLNRALWSPGNGAWHGYIDFVAISANIARTASNSM